MIARDAGQIEDLGAPRFGRLAGRPPHQIAPPILGDEREHEIAVGVDIVHRDEQLAESRLAEILGQQLRVSPRRARPAAAACSCAAPRTRSHITRQQ